MNLVKKIQSRVYRRWRYAHNDVRTVLGMNERVFRNYRGARIVIYHGLCQSDHTRFNSIFLQVKTFERHLQFYKKYFHVISLDDFYQQRFSKDRFSICISFDDGFANNYKYVLPLMNKYGVPVTFFITAIRDAGYDILWNDFLYLAQKYGPAEIELPYARFHKDRYGQYVSVPEGETLKGILRMEGFGKKAELMKLFEHLLPVKSKISEEDYWLQMTPEEIKKLSSSPLATVGCHGYYHNDLSKVSTDEARFEIIRSKQYLENITQKFIEALAFPYGAYSQNVVSEAKSAGFKKLLAMDFLFPDDYSDPTMRERFTVNPYISVNNQMLATINGKY